MSSGVAEYQFSLGERNFTWVLSQVTWSEAAAAAQTAGGQLLTVSSASDLTDIQSALTSALKEDVSELFLGTQTDTGRYVWLGVSDATTEGSWIWENATSLDYSNWSSDSDYSSSSLGADLDFAGMNVVVPLGSSDTVLGQWNDFNSSDAMTYVIEVVPNRAPILATATELSTDEDTASAAIAFSATDADGDTLTYVFSTPSKGSVVDNGDSTHTYTPHANENGSDSFTVTVNDGTVDVSQTVDVTINAVNDAVAVAGAVTITGTVTQGEVLSADTSALSDTDGLGTLSYQWQASGADISNANSSTYALTQAEVGKALTVDVSYTDVQGSAESATSAATSAVVAVQAITIGYIDSENTRTLFADQTLIFKSDADSTTVAMSSGSLATLSQDLSFTHLEFSGSGPISESVDVAAIVAEADLSGANLNYAGLVMKDLSGINLSSSNLYHTHFYSSNLSDADLSGALLVGCQRRTKTAPVAGALVRHLIGSCRSKTAPLLGFRFVHSPAQQNAP
jgi:uncharacterized protein YjbI with pentapeptide repeats